MIHIPEIWAILKQFMPRNKWIHIIEIYELVESNATLDDEDYIPQSPDSSIPKWKRNVRNVLQSRKKTCDIQWDENEKYLMP